MKVKCLLLALFTVLSTLITQFSTAQVNMVMDINPGPDDSQPSYMNTFNGSMYFSAGDSTHGWELWMHNDTTTSMVADIADGSIGSQPKNFQVYQNLLFFKAYRPDIGEELWVYNGDSVALEMDMTPGFSSSSTSGHVVFQNKLFFQYQQELYSYNDTVLTLEADLNGNSGSSPEGMIVYDGKLVFAANTSTYGKELWSFDGDTTVMEADINPGANSSNPVYMTEYDGKLYFRAGDNIHGEELWSFDGDTAILAAEIRPGSGDSSPITPYVYQDTLYTVANDGVHSYELWRYDGTTAQLVVDINTVNSISGAGSPFQEYAGKLFFNGYDGINGLELWSYDGTTAQMVADINPGSGNSIPTWLHVYNGKLYFMADDGVHGNELWEYSDPSLTSCNAAFSLYPDPNTSHNWFVVDSSEGAQPLTYEWSWGDGNTSTGPSATHTYDTAGYYNICLTIEDSVGCSSTYCDSSTYIFKTRQMITVNVVSELPNGVTEAANATNFIIYPNPTKNLIMLQSETLLSQAWLTDLTGRRLQPLLQDGSNRWQTDLSTLPAGMYMVEVITTDGKRGVSKVVRE